MSYLYSLLGITAWVITVGLSSNALIARENGLLLTDVERKIKIISNEQKISTVSVAGEVKELPSVSNQATVTNVEMPSGIQKKKNDSSRRVQNSEDEDEEDEDEDN